MNRTKNPAWSQLRLGLFFLAGLAVLMTSLFIVGTNQQLFARKYSVHIYLDNAQGLSRGALVALSGMEIGRVTDMEFTQHSGENKIKATLSIQEEFQPRITQNSVATIRTVGVLGDKFIDISLGDPSRAVIEEGGTVSIGGGTTDWAKTIEAGAGALDDFIEAVHQIGDFFAALNSGQGTMSVLLNDPQTAENFRTMIADFSSVGAALRSEQGTLGNLIYRPQTGEKLDNTLTSLESLAVSLDKGEGLLGRVIHDRSLADRVDHLVSNTDSLITSIQSEGTTGRLIHDEGLYLELEESVANLKALLKDIRENPDKYVRVSVF